MTNRFRGVSAIPADAEAGLSPGTPTVRLSKSESVCRVVVVHCYREVKEHGTISRRLGVDTKILALPGQMPDETSRPNSYSPVIRAVSREPWTRVCHQGPYSSCSASSTTQHGAQRPRIKRSSTTAWRLVDALFTESCLSPTSIRPRLRCIHRTTEGTRGRWRELHDVARALPMLGSSWLA